MSKIVDQQYLKNEQYKDTSNLNARIELHKRFSTNAYGWGAWVFDNYLEQEDIPVLGDVRVGQYLQPFSVDAMSGFRNLAFLERSLPFLAFVPFRRVGIMASNGSDDDRTHWAYSVFHFR